MRRFKLSKNTRNAMFVFLIAFSAFLAFEPLFNFFGQRAAQEFTAVIFGTIFAAVITMALLSRQTETEQEKDRNDKVFEQKIELYNHIIDTLQSIFEKSENGVVKISQREIVQIEFMLAKMMMVGSDKTIHQFKKLYEAIISNYSPEYGGVRMSVNEKHIVFRFADFCREELGLSRSNMEKEIIDDIVLQSELMQSMQVVKLDTEVFDMMKDIYGYLVFDLDVDSQNIIYTPNRFDAYTGREHKQESRFLSCILDKEQIRLIVNDDCDIKNLVICSGLQADSVGGQPALLLNSSDKERVKLHFDALESLIKESFDTTLAALSRADMSKERACSQE